MQIRLNRNFNMQLRWIHQDQFRSNWKSGHLQSPRDVKGTNAGGVVLIICIQMEHTAHRAWTKTSILCWQHSSKLHCIDRSTSIQICLLKNSHNFRFCAWREVRPGWLTIIGGLFSIRSAICLSMWKVWGRVRLLCCIIWRRCLRPMVVLCFFLLIIKTRCRLSVVRASILSSVWGLLLLLLPTLLLERALVWGSDLGVPIQRWHSWKVLSFLQKSTTWKRTHERISEHKQWTSSFDNHAPFLLFPCLQRSLIPQRWAKLKLFFPMSAALWRQTSP